MILEISEEQTLFQHEVGRFLERSYGFEQRRASLDADGGVNPEIWAGLVELGGLALPFPESVGGLGADALTLGLVMEAFGRHLVVEPMIAAIAAGTALVIGGSPGQKAQWLEPMLVGTVRLALAHEDMPGKAVTATEVADGWRLDGQKAFAPGAAAAHGILVSANGELFIVPADAPGLGLSPVRLVDGSQAAALTLNGVTVGDDARLPGAALDAALHAETLAACWEATGAMAAANAQTIEYVGQREQFGKPIAAFQTVQHTVAEMTVAVEEARAACILASLRNDVRTLSAAKVKCARSAGTVAKNAVQLHGGMGVSDELAIASYFRKLLAFDTLYGSTRHHLDSYVDAVLRTGKHHQSAVLGAAA